MQKLNFNNYTFRFKNSENKVFIFDVIRKKFVVLTPEEWVRQHTVHYLLHEKKYPESHLNIEKTLVLNNTKKRYDVVVFNKDGSLQLVVECKSAEIPITQEAFDQIARYNLVLNASYLMVTNGITHFFCRMDAPKKAYLFLSDIPPYIR